MRSIVLDTETTGLNVGLGDRIIEIGCVEILNRRITERTWHHYFNPERKSESGALAVHGISDDFLEDKPKFGDLAADFLDFIRGAARGGLSRHDPRPGQPRDRARSAASGFADAGGSGRAPAAHRYPAERG